MKLKTKSNFHLVLSNFFYDEDNLLCKPNSWLKNVEKKGVILDGGRGRT
jgi:hypothetical protein